MGWGGALPDRTQDGSGVTTAGALFAESPSPRFVPQPMLSVLIPNWNGAHLLPACFSAIARSATGVAIEIIVFDNGSTDSSEVVLNRWARRLPISVISASENQGFATANNKAWAKSRADYCLLLNNDALVCGSLSSAIDFLQSHPRVAACQGPLLSADGRFIDSVGSLMTRTGFLVHPSMGSPAGTLDPSREVFSLKGAAMYVRSAVVREIGLFDETAFAYFEESDFCWRVRLAGWEVTYSRELPPVRHVGGATSTMLNFSVSEFHSYKNRLRSIFKNAAVPTLFRMVPLHLGICCLAGLGATVRGRPSAVKNIVRAIVWNLRMMPDTLRARRAVQATRRRKDAEVFSGVCVPLTLVELLRLGRTYERGKKGRRTLPDDPFKSGDDETAVNQEAIAEPDGRRSDNNRLSPSHKRAIDDVAPTHRGPPNL